MPDSSLTRMFDAMGGVALGLWALVLIVILAGIALLLRAEKRQFARRGKARGWTGMRLLALPMLAVTAAAVLLPARAVSGPEGLAAFYLALFILAPLVWYGLHLVAGWLQSPRLARSESFGLATSGLGILIVPALLISAAQGPIFMIDHQRREQQFDQAATLPLAHRAAPVRFFRLGEAGMLYTQALQAPAGMHVERIRTQPGGNGRDPATLVHGYFCRDGEDVHLAWPAGAALAPLQIHWRDGKGRLVQTLYQVDTAAMDDLPPQDFTVAWRDDGLDLPAPISRRLVQLGWAGPDGSLHYRSLDMLQPGERFENDCVKAGYRRVAWQQEGPVAGVILRFYPPMPAAPWQAEFRRDAHATKPF
jgi:hypothetical protein